MLANKLANPFVNCILNLTVGKKLLNGSSRFKIFPIKINKNEQSSIRLFDKN